MPRSRDHPVLYLLALPFAGLAILCLHFLTPRLPVPDPELLRLAHSVIGAILIMTSATVFALAWNNRSASVSSRMEVSGLIYLGVALIAVLDLLSIQPFTFFNQSNTLHPFLNFGLAVRVLMICALLWCAFKPARSGFSRLTRLGWLLAIWLLFAGLVRITVFTHPASTLVLLGSQWASRWQISIDMLLAAACAWVMVRLLLKFEGLTTPIRWQLATSCGLLMLTSLLHTVSPERLSPHALLAVALTAWSSYFFYRAMVEGSVEYPHHRIQLLNQEMATSELRWRRAIEAGGHEVFEWRSADGPHPLLAKVHPQDLRELADRLVALSRAETDDLHHVFRAQHPDQRYRWFELRAAAAEHLTDRGRHVVGSLTDITSHKDAQAQLAHSEARLAGVIGSAMDGVISVDEAGHIVLFNRAAEQIFRCGAADVVGTSLDRFIPNRHREAHRGHIDAFGRTGVSQRSMGFSVLPAVRANGEEFPVSASISQIVVNDSRLYTAIVRDVSEQVAAERALRRSQQELTELSLRAQHALEDERRRVARELHDDFGQSLTAMRMELGMARQQVPPDHEELLEHCERMNAMITAMVTSTRRIATDLRPLVLDDLGLGAAIEWLVARFTDQHRIPCRVMIAPELTELEEPFASALFRIVQESLTNIARHSGASQAEVNIEFTQGLIRARVWDNGHGLKPDSLDQRTTFGLRGLRERAHLLGGEFEVFTRPGEGTTIQVSLPPPASL